ncbi:MAG: LptF/LptG family permease [Flavobacteriales bacterium]|nr:LptF/LptG family permease [Flavobacteriales bacterium]
MATFFISIFVLLMQFLWKYIDDLVGKGVDFLVFAKLLFYVSASLVPMALPLAILLSSLMTFGNLGEHYELVAFKSAGISLKRVLKPLAIVVFLLSIVAFLFSNYWLPVANLKSKSLLYDIKQQKPTMDIQAGMFSNDLDGITIRVKEKKIIDDVEHLYDVLIYDHKDGIGNRKVTKAEEGIMTITPDKHFLEFRLFNGTSYEDDKNGHIKKNYPLKRTKFKEYLIRSDLSQFNLNRTDENLFKSNYKMLNLSQLESQIDTLRKVRDTHFDAFKTGLKSSSFLYSKLNENTFKQARIKRPIDFDSLTASFDKNRKTQILSTAANLSRNSKSRLHSIVNDMYSRNKFIHSHEIQWHKKLTLPFACIILFLIGAPLGAIIRKGGLGMPIVISVVFFLLFHILSITGEKMAKEGALPSVEGMWMASAILLPIGLFFTYKATSDSALFRFDAYFNIIRSIFKKKEEVEK